MAASYQKKIWVLFLGIVMGAAMLLHMEYSRARQADPVAQIKKLEPITVESLKPSEMRSLTLNIRNH